jgi:hypothetical protein
MAFAPRDPSQPAARRRTRTCSPIGMAHTVGKKFVLVTRSDKDIPSDIKHFDDIPYRYDPEGVEALNEKLRTLIKRQLEL